MRPRMWRMVEDTVHNSAAEQCHLGLLLVPIELWEQAWVPGNALVGVQESVRSSLIKHPTQAGIVQASVRVSPA